MIEIIENPGLNHIVSHVSRFLDPKSLGQCRLVCHSWMDLIDNDRTWLTFQLEHINNQKTTFTDYRTKKEPLPQVEGTIHKSFPKWMEFTEMILRRQRSVTKLKKVTRQLWIYFDNKSKRHDKNPIQTAVIESNLEFLQTMLEACNELFGVTCLNRWRPMHHACLKSSFEIVAFLTKAIPTFDSTSKACSGEVIFNLAVENPDPEVPKLIFNLYKFKDFKSRKGYRMIHNAVACGPKETIQYLLESSKIIGINIEERTDSGSTILHQACGKRDIEIVDLVLKSLEAINSDIDMNTQDNEQMTPLHYACRKKNSAVAMILLKRYPQNINVLGQNGRHVLHTVCKTGNMELLKNVFDAEELNFDFNVTNQDGWTPLHEACWFGHFEAVKLILQNYKRKGIDIDKKNNSYQTPQILAWQAGHKDIFLLIKMWIFYQTVDDLLDLIDG